jgi:hypothetical protein
MKKYIQTMPAVNALQWTETSKPENIKFGVSSTTDRFDDTPDGHYVVVNHPLHGKIKSKLKITDWLIFDDKGENDNAKFVKQFSIEVPEDIKRDMDFVSRLNSDMGFMGSPSYDEANKRIEQWHNSN